MSDEDAGSSLFSLNIDDAAQGHLLTIAKWNKFVAVTGISVCSIVILVLVGYLFQLRIILSYIYLGNDLFEILFYLTFIAVFFVPCVFQLKFANK